jgi:lysophospholipase L1-like esterase
MAERRRLFVLGDSISIQYGPHLRRFIQHWCDYDRKREPGQSLEDLQAPVGGNGGDSSMVLQYLQEQQQLRTRYDMLLLNCGLHDIKTDPTTGDKQVPLAAYRQNLAAMCERAQEMSDAVVWVETTPVEDERHNRRSTTFHRYDADRVRYGEAAREILGRWSFPVVRLAAFTQALPGDPYCDHVHFTEDVRALQGAHIAGFLAATAVETAVASR